MENSDNKASDGIRAVENSYGLLLFRMALTHLIDVGVRHLTDENVAEAVEQIKSCGDEDKSNGTIRLMTPDFECSIVRCAAELAKFGIWDLIRYIKSDVVTE